MVRTRSRVQAPASAQLKECKNSIDEQKLSTCIDFLKEKYHPVEAIVPHSSRASGYAQQNSDWDFFVFIEYKLSQKQFRDNVEGEEIEFVVHQLPINKKDILDVFESKLKHVKIVYGKNRSIQNLINTAKKVYQAGIPQGEVTGARLLSQKHYLLSSIRGIRDNIDNEAMFMKKLGTFYPRIINIWYKFKRREYSDNIYISIPYIKDHDPVFFKPSNHKSNATN